MGVTLTGRLGLNNGNNVIGAEVIFDDTPHMITSISHKEMSNLQEIDWVKQDITGNGQILEDVQIAHRVNLDLRKVLPGRKDLRLEITNEGNRWEPTTASTDMAELLK